MSSPEEIRDWARREAAKLPEFTPAEVRQLAQLARELDSRHTDAAA